MIKILNTNNRNYLLNINKFLNNRRLKARSNNSVVKKILNDVKKNKIKALIKYEKKYLAKIIAKDSNGLQVISACCSNGKVKIDEIKFLKKNKLFLLSIDRLNKEKGENKKIKSICKFEFVDSVKSKNIDQKDKNSILELLAIDLFKLGENFEITLLFNNNAFITLSTEVLEITLEDQNKLND